MSTLGPTCIALFAGACLLSAGYVAHAADSAGLKPIPPDDAALVEFFARHDLVYRSAKSMDGMTGMFLGNGMLGAQVRCAARYGDVVNAKKAGGNWQEVSEKTRQIRIQVDRGDAIGPRRFGPEDAQRWVYTFGEMKISSKKPVLGAEGRLDLWNATARVTATTEVGSITVQAFIPRSNDVLVLHLAPSGAEEAGVEYEPHLLPDFRPHDSPDRAERRMEGDVHLCVQSNDVAGARYVAWQVDSTENGGKVVYVAVGFTEFNESPSPVPELLGNIQRARSQGLAALTEEHRQTWHSLMRRHLLSLPDTRAESQYWITMYRYCSMFRRNGLLAPLCGLWPEPIGSGRGCYFDFNTATIHAAGYAAGFADLDPLVRVLDGSLHSQNHLYGTKAAKGAVVGDRWVVGLNRVMQPDLLLSRDLPPRNISEVPMDFRAGDNLDPKYERGVNGNMQPLHDGEGQADLTHLLHDYYRHYRMTMDPQIATNMYKWCKLTMRSFLYMLGKKRDDGLYHLDRIECPEHGDFPDSPYGLSAIRFLCRTLLELDERWSFQDPERDLWKDILANLAPYPTKDGIILRGTTGKLDPQLGNKVEGRHWTHLYQIYPYHVLENDTPANEKLIRTSIDGWHGNRTWSFVAKVLMFSSIGAGNEAETVRATTMRGDMPIIYAESPAPLLETPCMAAQSTRYAFLQSHTQVIRVFPAMPDVWKDGVFHNMRAEGAFNVSAVRRGGKTEWVYLTSDSGEPCVVATDLARPIEAVGAREFTVKELANNTLEIDLKKGESVLLKTKGTTPDLHVQPVAAQEQYLNYYPERLWVGKGKPANQTKKKIDSGGK